MKTDDSVTQWIEQLRDGNEVAAERLWNRFFFHLTAVVRTRMRAGTSQLADDEDIALSAFKSVCLGIREGRFPELHNRESLWRLLMVVTTRKVADQFAFDRRGKRDINRQIGIGDADSTDDDKLVLSLVSHEPTPAMAAELADHFSVLFNALERADLKQVALLKMEGHTNTEIAGKLKRSLTTIERKLRTIRAIWKKMI